MNLTLQQLETPPAEYPAVDGVTGDKLAAAWQRVEHYIKVRFTEREMTWIVQSDMGSVWYAPVGPVISIEGEIMDGLAFALTPCGPGWKLPQGIVKLTATVGAGPVPAVVSMAVQRLAQYYDADVPVPAGVRSYSLSVGDMSESMTIPAARYARAMQESGAADLLRGYRSATPWLS